VLPAVISPMVAGSMWRLMFDNKFGPVNQIVSFFTEKPVVLLWTIKGNLPFWSIIIAEVWQWTPFMFIILMAAISNVDVNNDGTIDTDDVVLTPLDLEDDVIFLDDVIVTDEDGVAVPQIGFAFSIAQAPDIRAGGGIDEVRYNVNAPVSVYGGTGFDKLVILGTEFADDIAITKDGIFGAVPWPQSHMLLAGFLPSATLFLFTGWSFSNSLDFSIMRFRVSVPAPVGM